MDISPRVKAVIIESGGYSYSVGYAHVTEIKRETHNGEMASIVHYDIYKDNKLFSSVYKWTEIIYFQEEQK